MTKGHEKRVVFDVRTKLLVMLAVLSLPLLVISLIQLGSYQRSLNEQADTIARIETAAAAAVLEEWLEQNRAVAERPELLAPESSARLYTRLLKHAAPCG